MERRVALHAADGDDEFPPTLGVPIAVYPQALHGPALKFPKAVPPQKRHATGWTLAGARMLSDAARGQ